MKLVVPSILSVSTYMQGESCTTALAGDLVLVRGENLVDSGIRLFERLRRPKGVSKEAWRAACCVNHAAIVLTGGADATISEEESQGDIVVPLSSLAESWYAIVSFAFTSAERRLVVDFATAAEGYGYGFLSIFADLVNALTGLELSLSTGSRMVCSTMATRALERAGLVPTISPYATTPAHLALWFGVPRLGPLGQ